ncbi:DUF167 family protein [bacterium]|nr:DUF167 family protein [bacterium]
MPPFRTDRNDLLIDVRLTPRASRNAIAGIHDDRLKISVTSPPVDGKANAHLVKFLARRLGVAASSITIEAGANDRRKTLRVAGVTMETAQKRLLEDSS